MRTFRIVPDRPDPPENTEVCPNCNGEGCLECGETGEIDLEARARRAYADWQERRWGRED